MTEANQRVAVYGTLAPGRPNAHILGPLTGRWIPGQVNGTLIEEGWGAALGYPVLILDPEGPAVDVLVFESADLPEHWARLDEFEGPGYRRAVTRVRTGSGDLPACIYVSADQ